MCGIAGSISYHSENHPKFVEHMLEKMLHRGPDGVGIIQDGPTILGHRRLAILDLSAHANQPMWDTTRQFCIVFNGEIYNFASLKSELVQLGYQFHTQSDTEVLLIAWSKWGLQTLSKLTGMFAFALWDSKEKTLILARDRMGEKPLFYTGFNADFHQGLIFSSELKGLVCHPAINKKISMDAISEYLSQNYLLTETCIFEKIYKLPPAHYLIYQPGEPPKINNYWALENYFHQKNYVINFDDAKNKLNELISKSTTSQSYADVKVGAFLSGGLDSSTIASHMAMAKPDNVHTFSIGFAEKSYNELPASKLCSQHLKTLHKTKIVYPDIADILPKLVYAFDEPFADTSMIPTYFLSQFARNYVTVSLSGDGGDELFGGYATYQADRWHTYFNKLPPSMLNLLKNLSNHLPTSHKKISFDYKLKKFISGCLLDFQQAHASWRTIFSIDEKRKLFRPEFETIASINPFNKIEKWFNNVKDCHPLDQAMYVDMKTWLVDDILVKVDRASMAHSLEVRAPFLNHNIVEFAASMPIQFKIQGKQGKYILKQSQSENLPQNIINRRKEGFNAPIAHWLDNELRDMAYSLTTSNKLLHWFKKSAIEQLWDQHLSHKRDNSHHLFGLLNLALWIEGFNV